MFWAIFGTMVISFFILALFGFALNECILYSGSLGFFVGVYLKYRDIK
jgi:energy-converting hydrogenase Eha subunit A